MVHFSGWGASSGFSEIPYVFAPISQFLLLNLFLVDVGSCNGEKHSAGPQILKRLIHQGFIALLCFCICPIKFFVFSLVLVDVGAGRMKNIMLDHRV